MKTLKNLFKQEHFAGFRYEVDRELMAEKAQHILDRFIEENGVKVYGLGSQEEQRLTDYKLWAPYRNTSVTPTHQGILLDIQPLKQCEHKEAVYVENHSGTWFECEDCGKPVKSKGWEVV